MDDNNTGINSNIQTHYQSAIDELEKALQPDPKEVITSGYIFDPKILHDATKWYEANVASFTDWWSMESDVFWANGIGKLLNHLSARDAQVVKAGMGYFLDIGTIPSRTLKNTDGSSHSASSLGVDSDVPAGCSIGARVFRVVSRLGETLCEAKTAALQNLCNDQSLQRGRVFVK